MGSSCHLELRFLTKSLQRTGHFSKFRTVRGSNLQKGDAKYLAVKCRGLHFDTKPNPSTLTIICR